MVVLQEQQERTRLVQSLEREVVMRGVAGVSNSSADWYVNSCQSFNLHSTSVHLLKRTL